MFIWDSCGCWRVAVEFVRPRPHAEDHYTAIYDEIRRRKLVQSHIWDCYGASESPQPANEIRAGIRERLFCDRRQLCAANGIPPLPPLTDRLHHPRPLSFAL